MYTELTAVFMKPVTDDLCIIMLEVLVIVEDQ